MRKVRAKLCDAALGAVCVAGALGIGWGALVLLGKLVTMWGWW